MNKKSERNKKCLAQSRIARKEESPALLNLENMGLPNNFVIAKFQVKFSENAKT